MKQIFVLGVIVALLFIPCGVSAIEFYVTPSAADFGILTMEGGAGSNRFQKLEIGYNDTPGTMFNVYVQGRPDLSYPYVAFEGLGEPEWKRFLWNRTDSGTMLHLTRPIAIKTFLKDPDPPPDLAEWFMFLNENGRAQITNNATVQDDGWWTYSNWALIQPAKMTDRPGIYRTTMVLTVEDLIYPAPAPSQDVLAQIYKEKDIYTAPF